MDDDEDFASRHIIAPGGSDTAFTREVHMTTHYVGMGNKGGSSGAFW